MSHSLLAVFCLCIAFPGLCNTHISVRHLFAVCGSQTRFWALAQVWWCVKSVCPGWLFKMHALEDCTFSPVFVYPMLCGLSYFCSWTQGLPHSAVMLCFLFVEQITFFVVTLKMWKIEVLLYLPSSEIEYKPICFPSLKEKKHKTTIQQNQNPFLNYLYLCNKKHVFLCSS